MGWKKVKEHYDIKHIVCVTKEKKYGDEPVICIGSGFIHDLIVVSMQGKILKRRDSSWGLDVLQAELDEDSKSGKLRELIEAKDEFKDLKTVYRVCYKHIVEFKCEEYGYPNCTTDGRLMYENTFTSDLDEAKRWLLYRSRLGENFRYSVSERFSRVWQDIKRFKYSLKEIWEYVYVRLWGRFHVVKGSNEYD